MVMFGSLLSIVAFGPERFVCMLSWGTTVCVSYQMIRVSHYCGNAGSSESFTGAGREVKFKSWNGSCVGLILTTWMKD
ncbi:hypothetical protein D2E44_20415 [Mycobacteroides abscessus]|nr:hypothetical protein D2E44_20415 [Mycobacteroides abscessus]